MGLDSQVPMEPNAILQKSQRRVNPEHPGPRSSRGVLLSVCCRLFVLFFADDGDLLVGLVPSLK